MKLITIATLAALACSWAIWEAARAGLARTLTERAELTNDIDSADRAIKLAPKDAEAHFARGQVLQSNEDYAGASSEFERAVQLRPRDYFLWLMLGVTRDENQDQEGALRALRQATLLAPSYAPPRWQLGNLLLRLGQYDEAFAELRRAAIGNPDLWPNVIDLAWGIYGHDAGSVISALKVETDTGRMALALFFARHEQAPLALEQFRLIRAAPKKTAESLVDELLRARAFDEAYEVWARLHGLPLTSATEVRDGGFEETITRDQPGFGWRIPAEVPNVTLSIDEGEHQKGTRSLRLDFRGDSNPALPLVTQLVLVKPGTRYHLGVAALSKDFVSAADPVITLVDSSDPKSTVLAQSPPLRSDPNVWREFSVDFATNAVTRAITITVTRQACTNSSCPAFGTLWLDSVEVEMRSVVRQGAAYTQRSD